MLWTSFVWYFYSSLLILASKLSAIQALVSSSKAFLVLLASFPAVLSGNEPLHLPTSGRHRPLVLILEPILLVRHLG